MKSFLPFALAFSSALTFGACASAVYVKSGSTNAAFQREELDCQVKAGQAGYVTGQGLIPELARKKFISQCLNVQGWTEQDQKS